MSENEKTEPPKLFLNVNHCARCKKDHYHLEMKRFTNPIDDFFYFAICPELREPILVKIELESDNRVIERPKPPKPSERQKMNKKSETRKLLDEYLKLHGFDPDKFPPLVWGALLSFVEFLEYRVERYLITENSNHKENEH